jgi:hypothetical protein
LCCLSSRGGRVWPEKRGAKKHPGKNHPKKGSQARSLATSSLAEAFLVPGLTWKHHCHWTWKDL